MTKEISTIFWDVGAVLFSNAQISGPEFKPVRELFGLDAKESDEIFFSLWEDKVRLGKITEDEFWEEYLKRSSKKPALNEIKDLYRKCTLVNEELLELAKNLSDSYNQTITSNHGKEWMRFLVSNWNLDKMFDNIICSADIGIGKPDRKFFEFALEKSKFEPSQVLYIDNEERHLVVAEKVGINILLYSGFYEDLHKGNENLIAELRKWGIVI